MKNKKAKLSKEVKAFENHFDNFMKAFDRAFEKHLQEKNTTKK
jgi:hypothetical protein